MQNKGSNETILPSKTGIENTAERRNSNRGDSPHIKKNQSGSQEYLTSEILRAISLKKRSRKIGEKELFVWVAPRGVQFKSILI